MAIIKIKITYYAMLNIICVLLVMLYTTDVAYPIKSPGFVFIAAKDCF